MIEDENPLEDAFYESLVGRRHWKWIPNEYDVHKNHMAQWINGQFTIEQIQEWLPIVGEEDYELAKKFIQNGITGEQVQFIVEHMVTTKFINKWETIMPFSQEPNPLHLADNINDWAMELLLSTLEKRIKTTPSD